MDLFESSTLTLYSCDLLHIIGQQNQALLLSIAQLKGVLLYVKGASQSLDSAVKR